MFPGIFCYVAHVSGFVLCVGPGQQEALVSQWDPLRYQPAGWPVLRRIGVLFFLLQIPEDQAVPGK